MASRVDAHRRDINDLVRLAQVDLGIVLATYTGDAEGTRDALLIALPALVDVYGAAAATLGADWYADLRDEAAARGRFTPITAELPDVGRTDALARWGVEPLFSDSPDVVATTSRLEGGLQRIVANADRQTITTSATEDRRCQGWRRVTSAGCDFCRELAAIEWGQKVPDFKTHDHCRCVAVPEFG